MPSIYEAIKPKKNSIYDAIAEPSRFDIPEQPTFFGAMEAAHRYTDVVTEQILQRTPDQIRENFFFSPEVQSQIGSRLTKKGPFEPDSYQLVFPPSSQEQFEADLNSIVAERLPDETKKALIRERVISRKKQLYQETSNALNAMYHQMRLFEEKEAQKGKRLKKYYRSWERGWGRVGSAGLQLAGEIGRSQSLKDEARYMHKGITSPEMASFNEDWFDWVMNTTLDTAPFMITAMAPAALTGGATIPGTIGSFAVAFAVEGNSAYQSGLDRGLSEKDARIRGIVTGLLNGGIEVAGGGANKYFKTLAVNKTLTKLAKAKTITKGILRNALKEGLAEEIPQEMVQMVVGGDVPRNEDGSVDWGSVADRLLQAGAAGAMLGFGGSAISMGSGYSSGCRTHSVA